LAEGGATALGPALSVCVGIASAHRRSEIILCTDGAPNVGIGSLDDHGLKSKSIAFYHMIGKRAQENESIISIIGIDGADCSMEHLSICSEATSGSSNILVPLELVREIRRIGQRKVIATDVEATVLLHPYLQLAAHISPEQASKVVINVGNGMCCTE
jgi:hypothetical protein